MKEELANDLRSGSVGDGTGDNQDSLASQFIQVLPSGKRTLNQKKLMRYLVNLVCKSMTYLLQNEVKLQAQVAQYSGLERKVDELTAQVNAKPATFLELTPALSNSGAGTSAGYRRSADPTDQRDNSSQAEDEDYSRMCSVYDNYDTSTNVSTNMTSSSSRESLMRTPDLSVTPSAPPPPPPLPPAFNTPVTHSRAQAQTQAQTALSGKSKIQMFAPRVSTVNTLNSNSTRSTAPSTATTPTPSKGNALARSKAQPPIFIPQASSLSADISTPTMKYSQDEETTAADSAAPLVYVPTNTRATDSTPLRMPGTSTTDWLFASSPSSTTNSASSGAAPVWTSKSSTPSDFVSSMELNKTVDIYNHHLPDADATVSSDDELDEHADRLSYHPTKPVFMTSADSVADPAPNAPMNVKAVQFASSNNVSAYVC